jgi:hypothetical protein
LQKCESRRECLDDLVVSSRRANVRALATLVYAGARSKRRKADIIFLLQTSSDFALYPALHVLLLVLEVLISRSKTRFCYVLESRGASVGHSRSLREVIVPRPSSWRSMSPTLSIDDIPHGEGGQCKLLQGHQISMLLYCSEKGRKTSQARSASLPAGSQTVSILSITLRVASATFVSYTIFLLDVPYESHLFFSFFFFFFFFFFFVIIAGNEKKRVVSRYVNSKTFRRSILTIL